jgi:hypothetical protein
MAHQLDLPKINARAHPVVSRPTFEAQSPASNWMHFTLWQSHDFQTVDCCASPMLACLSFHVPTRHDSQGPSNETWQQDQPKKQRKTRRQQLLTNLSTVTLRMMLWIPHAWCMTDGSLRRKSQCPQCSKDQSHL